MFHFVLRLFLQDKKQKDQDFIVQDGAVNYYLSSKS